MSIGIIDYGAGNLRSVANATRHLGFDPVLIRQPDQFADIDQLIFPGVGSFGDCVANLHQLNLWQAVTDWVRADRPFFGICLGYQVLFESSEESPGVGGLGVLAGSCVRFPAAKLKVPHMGWNTVQPTDPADPAWSGLSAEPWFYFVHSYYPRPANEDVVAGWTDYGGRFAAAVRRGNLLATQFHPERSQSNGLTLLGNFLSLRGQPAAGMVAASRASG